MRATQVSIMKKSQVIIVLFVGLVFSCSESKAPATVIDPLPSWQDVSSKTAIINFVEEATNESSEGFIPVEDRIATFDNDGTLWSEQPMYFQLIFAIDRIKSMAKDHPEWKTAMPYSAILENDIPKLLAEGEHALIEIIMMSHANMTAEEFKNVVIAWASTAEHPTKKKLFTELVYQPMLELLTYLQDNEFKTYIVSGGGVDFMRPIVSEVYNIPAEQIIGSTIKTKFNYNDGNPTIERLPELFFIDDKAGKPENIQRIIGKKPVLAAGNSDGDLAMLQWTASNEKFLNIYVHHTDAEREWAYDRDSHIGRLDQGLDQANSEGWTVVDMKNDWKIMYPFEK